MLRQAAAHIPVNNLCREAVEALHLCRDRAARDLAVLEISAASIDSLLAKAKADLIANVAMCESPIEQVMLVALSHMVVPETDCFPPAVHNARSKDPWPVRPVVVCPQFAVARYRLDFLVALNRRWIAVECDGAAHHATIPGRLRDEARDGYLEAMGIATLRYTGSWIIRNSFRVADEIAALAREPGK